MSFDEILSFLRPDLHSIQAAFAVVMLALTAWTLIALLVYAKPKAWESKWKSRADSGHLDTDHSSVHEVADVVASRAEKLAENMPGILLTIGLLGTFLGLGVALNSAAAVLAHPANDSAALGNTMQQLTPMMEGLGTKFKTSTWGIILFLFLKAVYAFRQDDEKRLQWCIRKIGATLSSEREKHIEEQARARVQLIDSIDALGTRMTGAIHDQAKQQSDDQQKVLGMLTELTGSSARTATTMDSQLTAMRTLGDDMRQTRVAIEEFIDANVANIESMREAGEKMSSGATEVARSAAELLNGVASFKTGVDEVLGKLESKLTVTIEDMNGNFERNLATMARQLERTTANIGEAVEQLNAGVAATMGRIEETMAEATANQTDAIDEFTACSNKIQTTAAEMNQLIDRVTSSIAIGLTDVGKAGLKMESVALECKALTQASIKTASDSKEISQRINDAVSMLAPAARALIEQGRDQDLLKAANRLVDLQVASEERTSLRLEQIVDLLDKIGSHSSDTMAENSFQ
jgi:methyl-accepting chemotaxis protein